MPFSAKNGGLFLSDTGREAARRLGITGAAGGSLIPITVYRDGGWLRFFLELCHPQAPLEAGTRD